MKSTRSPRCDGVEPCSERNAKVASAHTPQSCRRGLAASLAAVLACVSCAASPGAEKPVSAYAARAPSLAAPASTSREPLRSVEPATPPRWSRARAQQWHEARGWLVGVNYLPSTAINQLEMWQQATFDPVVIDRELGWAESLGFNSLRVFLHDLAWKQDEAGFYARLDEFLSIAQKHHLGVMLVIFDGVWNPLPKPGEQPAPRPHVHNSGWVQSPGAEILGSAARHDELEPYVKGTVGPFKDDARVDAWDVFNEPDNPNTDSYASAEVKDKAALAARLIDKTFRWAREAGASQPLTAAPWLVDSSNDAELSASDRAMLEGSDIISFHNYAPPEQMRVRIENLRRYGRPVICSEYMARPLGSTFDPLLGYLKEQGGGAYSWGFVSGKSQTIYPWSSWKGAADAAPEVWFHDIFGADGKPYDPEEVAYIRRITGKKPNASAATASTRIRLPAPQSEVPLEALREGPASPAAP